MSSPLKLESAPQEEYVEGLLKKLGLTKCAATIVGDARARGISGGEKKRLSIGCELIASPNLVFAGELPPTIKKITKRQNMTTSRLLVARSH